MCVKHSPERGRDEVISETTSPPPFGGGVGEADGGGFTVKQKYSSKAIVTIKPLSVFRCAQNHFPRKGEATRLHEKKLLPISTGDGKTACNFFAAATEGK